MSNSRQITFTAGFSLILYETQMSKLCIPLKRKEKGRKEKRGKEVTLLISDREF